jgi:hemerythrin
VEHYVEWKPFYSVGHNAIDAEHKRLLEIVDDLFLAIQSDKDGVHAKEVLERLAEYTIIHFDHEERVMQGCAYPRLEAHRALHDEMRRQVFAWREDPYSVADHDLLRFVKTWWVQHIQHADKEYSPYLAALSCQDRP